MNESISNTSTIFPETWAKARKERKKVEKRIIDYIIQGLALAVLLVVSLPLFPIFLLCRLAGNLKEKAVTVFGLNKTLPSVRAMKHDEEFKKFQTMKDVFKSYLLEIGLQTTSVRDISKAFIQDINFNSTMIVDLMAEECKRLIVRELGKKAGFQSSLIPALVDLEMDRGCVNEDGTIDWTFVCKKMYFKNVDLQNAFQDLLFSSKGAESTFATKLSEKMHRRHLEVTGIEKNAVKHLASFLNRFNKLTEILNDSENLQTYNPAQANRSFIAVYRDLLKHPIYKALRLSSSHRSINLLHDVSAAIWNSVDPTEAYKNVGKAIIADGNLSPKNEIIDPNVPDNVVIANKLRKSQKTVCSNHYQNDSLYGKISYAVMHFWQTVGGFASMGGRKRIIPSLLGVGQYDSHGTLSNNPSKQSTTSWRGDLLCGQVNNCYGGSPTIGDHRIAPEFKALLQAAENNLMRVPRLRRKGIPSKIVFGSLQDSDFIYAEGARTQTLMYCNQAFPLSFIGYVLAKDSPLYKMTKSENIVWEDAKQFGQILKKSLMLGINAPTQKGHGFYFAGPSERWEELFNAIIDEVNIEFKDKQALKLTEKQNLQAAYQDHVYSLISTFEECRTLADLNAMGVVNPLITTLNVCKENIDRGAMENLKLLYLRINNLPKDKPPLTKDEILESLVGFMNSRSLSSRDRAILEHRVAQVLPFIETVSPENFDRSLMSLLHRLGLDAQYEFVV
ncbi:MAG: hypothetical protein H0W50_08930 [Parachlamydiaceae bacterium]|nr:hypothetical protein [Parachlamydiaceae bacterium]